MMRCDSEGAWKAWKDRVDEGSDDARGWMMRCDSEGAWKDGRVDDETQKPKGMERQEGE